VIEIEIEIEIELEIELEIEIDLFIIVGYSPSNNVFMRAERLRLSLHSLNHTIQS
jgi:hypothetical protein